MKFIWLKRYTSFCLLSFFYYALMRFEFLSWNFNQFRQLPVQQFLQAFTHGARFDSVAIFLISLPLFLLLLLFELLHPRKVPVQKKLWQAAAIFSLVLHFFLMSLSLVDTEFVNFTGKRFSLETLFILRETQGKMGNFILSYWQLWLINPIIVFSFLYFSWRILNSETGPFKIFAAIQRLSRILSSRFVLPIILQKLIFAALAIVAFVTLARGGLQKKPLTFVDAKIFDSSLMNQMVLNSAFTMIKSAGKSKLPHYHFFDSPNLLKAALQSFTNTEDSNNKTGNDAKNNSSNGLSNGSSHRTHNDNLKNSSKDLTGFKGTSKEASKNDTNFLEKPNIVVIILESFSLEYMGLDGRKSYTPFLDSLAKKSLFFKNSFADGRRSIEGVGAIMAGIPAWMEEPFISSEFATNQILGMGSWLKARGYSTSFFHGGMNGTMYFDSFAKSTGFDQYYGFNEYPNKSDFDGTWGVFDEPFLQFMISKLNTMEPPFAATVFTLSSHQPYKIPDKYKDKFKGGPIEILASIEYADYALKLFFEQAAQQKWYKDTLFILTADHTGRAVSKEFDHDLGFYQIPIMFFSPQEKFQGKESLTSFSQIDILPTLQGFLGEKSPVALFGKDGRNGNANPVILCLGDNYLVVDNFVIMTWSLQEGAKLFERKIWPQKKIVQDAQLLAKYENFLKANLQNFSMGLYDNKLYYPTKPALGR